MKIDHHTIPEIGILVQNAGANAVEKSIIIRDNLRSRYVRFTAISAQNWTGSSSAYEDYRDSGLIPHVVLDVGFDPGAPTSPNAWITDVTSFNLDDLEAMFRDLVATYPELKGKVIMLDNEECNSGYHSGTQAQYRAIALRLQPVCDELGILLASGGFGDFFAIHAYIFRYVKAKYGTLKADQFAATVFLNGTSGSQYDAANTPDSNPTLEQHITDLLVTVNADCFNVLNFHMYVPTGDQTDAVDAVDGNDLFWRYAFEAFSQGHPTRRRFVSCNEWWARQSEHSEIITSVLNSQWRYGYLFSDAWSGLGLALQTTEATDDSGNPTLQGIAFGDWEDAHYENISMA